MISRSPSTLFDLLTLYKPYAPDLSPRTFQKIGHEIKRWNDYTGGPPVSAISLEHFCRFREVGLQRNLSPDSIETNIGTVLTLLRFAHQILATIDKMPVAGRGLRRNRSRPRYLDAGELGKLYRNTHVTNWPRTHVRPRVFWRCWIAFAYFTGLRLEDQMHGCHWQSVTEDHILVTAGKTRKMHCFPMHPVLQEHIERMRGGRMERIFPVSKSPHLIRRELAKISEAAGIDPHVTPKNLRQTSGTHWERAKTGAGRLLLGHTLGVSGHYIHVPELLCEAAKALEVPKEFYTQDNSRQLTLF